MKQLLAKTRRKLLVLTAVGALLVGFVASNGTPALAGSAGSVNFGYGYSAGRYSMGHFTLWNTYYSKCKATFQGDGNLVLYNRYGTAVWSSRTNGKLSSQGYLALQTDGNVVIYSGGTWNGAAWASHTNYAPRTWYFGFSYGGNFGVFERGTSDIQALYGHC